MDETNVAIIIPVYKRQMSGEENISFKRILKVFEKYDIYVIHPFNITMEHYPDVRLKSFDQEYFDSIAGYNRLMLSKRFYLSFKRYKYILINQLDAYPFKDELSFWINKKYDYIGAPWAHEHHYKLITSGKYSWVWEIMAFINRKVFFKRDWYIGNGGFSLRNVDKSLTVLKYYSKFANKQYVNEDLFWSIYAPLIYPFFKVPNLHEAMGFAFEMDPEIHFERNNNKLPFGCHGWNKYNSTFWKKFIENEEIK